MIVLRAVRVEDTGAETELGEIRLTEVGAVFAHSSTPEGQGVVADVVERMRAAMPDAHARGARQVKSASYEVEIPRRALRPHERRFPRTAP